ncbi:MAG: hypothetical protein RR565_06965 [Erysipelothrix sp.]
MRKYIIVFSVLVSILSFNGLYDFYNTYYNQMSAEVAFGRIQSGDLNGVEFRASTHFLEEPHQFFENIINVSESNNDEVAIYISSFDEDGVQTGLTFTNIRDNSGFSTAVFSRDISDIHFDRNDEVRYLTTNPNIEDPNATFIEYLKEDYDYFSDVRDYRNSFYYPLSKIQNHSAFDAHIQFSLVYLSEKSVEEINDIVYEEIMDPYNFCGTQECKSVYRSESLLDQYQERKLTIFGSYWYFGSVTKKIFIVSAALLLITLAYSIFNQTKEIMVRRLNGNNQLRTYLSITFMDYLVTVLAFSLTTLVLWFVNIGSFSALSYTFTMLLIKAILGYSLWILIVYALIFVVIRSLNIVKYLKTAVSSYGFLLVSMISKGIIVFSLMVICMNYYESYDDTNIAKMIRSQDPEYMNRISISMIQQPYFPFIHPQDSKWEEEINPKYLKTIDKYNLGIFADVLLYPTKEIERDVVYANQTFLEGYDIKDLEGNPISFESMAEDTLLVPRSAVPKIDSMWIDDLILFIDTVPLLKSEKAGVVVDSTYEKMVLFMAHPEKYFDYYDFDIFYYDNKTESSLVEVIKDITNNIGYVQGISNQARDTYFQKQVNIYKEMVVEFYISLCIFVLIADKLIHRIILESHKKKIAVQYLSGISRLKRYRGVILGTLAPMLIGLSLVIKEIWSNYFNIDFVYTINLDWMYLMIVSLIILDCIVLIYDLYQFEKTSLSEIIKGGSI